MRVTRAYGGSEVEGAGSENECDPLRECRLALQPRAGGAARRQLRVGAAILPVPDWCVRCGKILAVAAAVSRAETDARADQSVRSRHRHLIAGRTRHAEAPDRRGVS